MAAPPTKPTKPAKPASPPASDDRFVTDLDAPGVRVTRPAPPARKSPPSK